MLNPVAISDGMEKGVGQWEYCSEILNRMGKSKSVRGKETFYNEKQRTCDILGLPGGESLDCDGIVT